MLRGRLLWLVCLVSAACGGGEDTEVTVPTPSGDTEARAERLTVRDLRIGTAAEEGRGVTQEAVTFQPGDSVFLSAELEGDARQVSVAARFSFQDGSIVGGEERFLALSGTDVVTFSLAPIGGLASGRYRAELLLGDQRVGMREFTVE